MPIAFVNKALVQGDMNHAGARQAPKGFNGSWNQLYDRKTGQPERVFTIEERTTDESGKTKVTGYFNCVAKTPAIIEAIEAAQWTEVSLVGELVYNRDTKYLQIVVNEVVPAESVK